MQIHVTCDGCGQTLRLNQSDAGKTARCPKCANVFTIPDGEPPSNAGPSSETPFMNQAPPPTEQRPQSALPDAFKPKSALPDAFKPQSQPPAPQPPTPDPSASPFADAAGVQGGFAVGSTAKSDGHANPYQAPPSLKPTGPTGAAYSKPHRGDLILWFGIIGICCCVGFGVAAWIMGASDLRQMREGVMDPSGKGTTNGGMILGIISVVLNIANLAYAMVQIVLEQAVAGF